MVNFFFIFTAVLTVLVVILEVVTSYKLREYERKVTLQEKRKSVESDKNK